MIQFEQPINARFNPGASTKDIIEVLKVNSGGSLSGDLAHIVLLKSAPLLLTLESDSDDDEEETVEFILTTKGRIMC